MFGHQFSMEDLEIPLGKRTAKYRFFEMLPAILSYGAIIILIVLSIFSPLLAAIYLMLVITTMIVKAVGIAYHTIRGNNNLQKAQKINWRLRLQDFENPSKSLLKYDDNHESEFGLKAHIYSLEEMSNDKESFPKPSEIYNVAIVATYNETYETLEPTVRSVLNSSYDKARLIIMITYEERGGEAIEKTVRKIQDEYKGKFVDFLIVKHPNNIKDEVKGKGGNITYAGKSLQKYLDGKGIKYKNVIVTTLDSDNRPYPTYFDYVTYEFIAHKNRKHMSFQPISLFLNNIWDAPAPMRVVATGNSFWNIISSMRPHTLRNFAAHSQPMDALVGMNFWSTRTIVEDGHQYWRSYFHFNGNYTVHPIYVPIYQDAVLAGSYTKTLKAQFIQLRRWAYGASDVPYVATRIFSRQRNVPLVSGLARLMRLLDGHITLASVSLLVAFGAWVPLLINSQALRDPVAHQLPDVVSIIQRIAMIGLMITVFLAFKMLPPRPARYKRRRSVWMILQWVLMPLTAVGYSSMAAFTSQTRLLFGKYLDKFDVTDKANKTASVAVKSKNNTR